MKKYIIYYYAEVNDECVDFEKEVFAYNIRMALNIFEQSGTVHKKIHMISEKPNVVNHGN